MGGEWNAATCMSPIELCRRVLFLPDLEDCGDVVWFGIIPRDLPMAADVEARLGLFIHDPPTAVDVEAEGWCWPLLVTVGFSTSESDEDDNRITTGFDLSPVRCLAIGAFFFRLGMFRLKTPREDWLPRGLLLAEQNALCDFRSPVKPVFSARLVPLVLCAEILLPYRVAVEPWECSCL
jgi:hypothetical protein